MAILSFNGRVNIAVRIVTKQYPQAKLYEADGIAMAGPTTSPAQVNHMRVVFQNINNTTVIIEETGYGEFSNPILVPQPWLEDVVISWPIKMDLPEANKLKEKAGFKQPYSTVTLRNPLGPKPGNPCFIFGSKGQPFIFVDTVTGQVNPETASIQLQPVLAQMPGGWTPFSGKISKEAAAVFAAATKNLLGVKYTPVAVATQVVAGCNYAFFCNGTVVYPNAPNEAFIITIFAPLKGGPVIREIKRVM